MIRDQESEDAWDKKIETEQETHRGGPRPTGCEKKENHGNERGQTETADNAEDGQKMIESQPGTQNWGATQRGNK